MSGAAGNECITVVVRCRPMNRKEIEETRSSIIQVDMAARQISITNPDAPGDAPKSFTYDATYDEKTQQRIFYEESCFNIVDSTLEGFNSTIFAYGQTGCGKSFTMQGPSVSDDEMKGVIPNSFSHIFQFVKSTPDIEFLIRCSYLELYNEEIRDLLANPKTTVKCELREDPNKGVYVTGLTDVVVESPEDLSRMLDKGLTNRTTASTLMNSESSRSHSIFTIVVEMNTKDEATGKDMLRVGKLNLVDLAGSERAKKTGAKGAVLQEGIKINLSLSVLGNVISALAEGGRHIPYRDSKLTRLLQDSLGGNTKTMMVAAISPADYNYEETLSTLRYANRAKNIKNKPKINEDPKDTMIREFKAEIERLRKLLAEAAAGGGAVDLAAMLGGMGGGMAGAGGVHKSMSSGANSVASGPDTSTSHTHSSHQPTLPPHPKNSPPRPTPQSSNAKAVHNKAEAKMREVESKGQWEEEVADTTPRYDEEEVYEDNFETPSPVHSTSKPPVAQHQQHAAQGNDQQSLRFELENRLHQLEHLLVNNHEDEGLGEGEVVDDDRGGAMAASMKMSMKQKTAQQLQEEEALRVQYRERKLKAKKKKDEKQAADMQRILEEKKMMEDELEELRQVNQANQPNKQATVTEDAMNKKIAKMKKKYEKKLQSVREELEEVKEEFSYQRKALLESMVEQEKDSKLYELICKSVLSEKDLNKIIEKCRYDDETDEWIVPFTKKKNIEHMDLNMPMASGGMNSGRGGGLLPDINSNGMGNGMSMGMGMGMGGGGAYMGNNNNNKGFDQTMRMVSAASPMNSARPDSAGRKEKKTVVPLLTLPGTLTTAADVLGENSRHLPSIHANNNYNQQQYYSDDGATGSARDGRGGSSGGGSRGLGEEKKKKNKTKSSNKSKVEKMPLIGGAAGGGGGNVGYGIASEDAGWGEGDRDGRDGDGGGAAVGPVEDWGFVLEDKGHRRGGGNPEMEYSDDEDFVTESAGNGGGAKKKKKKKHKKEETGGGSSLPPIGGKGTSLPPI